MAEYAVGFTDEDAGVENLNFLIVKEIYLNFIGQENQDELYQAMCY